MWKHDDPAKPPSMPPHSALQEMVMQGERAAGLRRTDAAAELAKRLGYPGHQRALTWYHRLECGTLDLDLVDPRVFEEWGAMLALDPQKLRELAVQARRTGGEWLPASPPRRADAFDHLFLGQAVKWV